MKPTRLWIASDHGGWKLKEALKDHFRNIEWMDLGPKNNDQSVDYPDFADLLCSKLTESTAPQGVLICGSGQGMAMRANKYQWIRAALAWNKEIAALARDHNGANVLCLGERVLSEATAFECLEAFISTPFSGGRHQIRIQKVALSTPSQPQIVKKDI